MRHNEGLANDVGPLEMRKTGLKLAFRDELLRQSDLVVEGDTLNRIHALFSIAT